MTTIALQRLTIRARRVALPLQVLGFAREQQVGQAMRHQLAATPIETARGAGARRISERALVRAAQDGSEQALEELFRRHWPRAHRAAYVVVRDAAAAEDIAQEAFLSAIRALGRFDRRRPFSPWLHRIVVNRAIDWSRARSLRRETVGSDAVIGTAADERDLQSAAGITEELDAALTGLSPEHRAVVVLRYLLDYTPGEIARMLELPRGTVNSRLRRALDRLATELKEEEESQ